MQILAFDGRMGASGDMLLGALLAAGADPAVLETVEDAIDVRYRIERVDRAGIRATSVDVVYADDNDPGLKDRDHRRSEASDHGPVNGEHAEEHGPHRTYPEVVSIVESMALPSTVETDALAVFELLGKAEAAVHGTDLDDTQFHEVGADDAIADVVGVTLLLHEVDPDRIVTTPLATGGGEVEVSHGRYPVPTPAVVELAEMADWPVTPGPVEAELLTPTGAAILAHVATGVETIPPMHIETSGHGAGDRTFPDHPNVLRALGGTATDGLQRDDITILETNLDDATPEVLGSLQTSLLESGARDVTVVPTTMKKARPGHLVKVIVKPDEARQVARTLARETGTLGIRETPGSHRWIADRRLVTTTLSVADNRHEVMVKVGELDGEAYDVSAEYDDAQRVATKTGLPVRDVLRRAEAAARQGGALEATLVHIIEADRWPAVEADGTYAPPSLDKEGFVHLSPVRQAPAVAQTNYADADDPRLLLVDRAAIEPDLKYEETAIGAYPHLYRPLTPDDVRDVIEFPRRDGRFVLPPVLRDD